ncbi:MAG: 3'-5' exonuclease [Bacillota bacterium]
MEGYVSFDIESCNGKNVGASMCSFGYAVFDKDCNKIKKEDILMRPMVASFKLSSGRGGNGIELAYSEDAFMKSPKFPVLYNQIKEILQSKQLVLGFSISNDLNFLNNACDEYGLERIEFSYIDVQKIHKQVFETENFEGLSKLAERYEIEFLPHRSDEDAFVTATIFEKILQELGVSFEEFMTKYKKKFQTNKKEQVIVGDENYSKRVALSTVKSKKILMHSFIESQKEEKREKSARPFLNGKGVCFSDTWEYEDINFTRRLIARLYALGGKYNGMAKWSKYLIIDSEKEGDKDILFERRIAHGEKVSTMEKSEFIKMLGEIPEMKFDDWKTLCNHKKEVKKERYKKIARENRLGSSTKQNET